MRQEDMTFTYMHHLTIVYKQKLAVVNVCLSEVHNGSTGSALQSQVTVTGLSDHVV